MAEIANLFLQIYVKLYFLLTPFFVLTMFLALTRGQSAAEQKKKALRVTAAVIVISLTLYHFGNLIFAVFGITLDAFRIGAGALLFLSGVDLVRGEAGSEAPQSEGDVAVVPLAVPITVGPATVGALLVMGAQQPTLEKLVGSAALLAAVLSVGAMLYAAAFLERLLGRQGLVILSKLTGLVLAALAAQIVFTGIQGFLC